MVEMHFIHPGFTVDQSDNKLIEHSDGTKIVRIQYPDGVIAQFIMDTNGKITVQSNRSFIIDIENGEPVIRPNLYDVNSDFVDIR